MTRIIDKIKEDESYRGDFDINNPYNIKVGSNSELNEKLKIKENSMVYRAVGADYDPYK